MMGDSIICTCWQQIRCSSPLSFFGHSQFLRLVRHAPVLLFSIIPLLLLAAPNAVQANDYILSKYTLASCDVLQCATNISNPNSVNYFPEKTAADDLQFWDIYYANTYKILEIPATGEQYVLYECGTTMPTAGNNVSVQYIQYSNAGQQLTGNLTVEIRPDAKFFKIPLKHLCVIETVSMSYLELLGVRGAIARAEVQYIASPCIDALASSGAIGPLNPYSGDIAQQEANCDAIIAVGNNANPDPRAITFEASADKSLLDRAEYLEYLAVFFNREAVANSLMAGIRNRFNQYATLAALQPVSPLSAWITHNSFAAMPYYIDTTPYKLELLEKAGTIPYIPQEPNFATPQALMSALRNAGVTWVLDETYHPYATFQDFATTWALNASDLQPTTTTYPFLRTQQVFRNDRSLAHNNGADDWFESALPNVDAVLYDFIVAVFPAINPTYNRIWLRNIAIGETVQQNLQVCTDPSLATVPLKTDPATLTATAFAGCPNWYTDPRLYGTANASSSSSSSTGVNGGSSSSTGTASSSNGTSSASASYPQKAVSSMHFIVVMVSTVLGGFLFR